MTSSFITHTPVPIPPCLQLMRRLQSNNLLLEPTSFSFAYHHCPTPTKHDPEKHIQLVLPTISDIVSVSKSLINLAFPMVLIALILYSCSILSILFLSHLGDLQLVAGSLAIAFANITGYFILSSLALGMEPFCYQAFGANRPKLLSVTLHCTMIFLLSSIPISLL
jgi:MATE family multidrug resistance protein